METRFIELVSCTTAVGRLVRTYHVTRCVSEVVSKAEAMTSRLALLFGGTAEMAWWRRAGTQADQRRAAMRRWDN